MMQTDRPPERRQRHTKPKHWAARDNCRINRATESMKSHSVWLSASVSARLCCLSKSFLCAAVSKFASMGYQNARQLLPIANMVYQGMTSHQPHKKGKLIKRQTFFLICWHFGTLFLDQKAIRFWISFSCLVYVRLGDDLVCGDKVSLIRRFRAVCHNISRCQ